MQRIEVVQQLDLPVPAAFAHLAEHEHLGPLFGARITRVRDGHEARNGVGSVRRLRVGLLPPFEETVTGFEPDTYLEYRITRGSPLRDHVGTLRFRPSGPGTVVTWTILFRGALPLVGPLVRLPLERSIRAGLRALAASP